MVRALRRAGNSLDRILMVKQPTILQDGPCLFLPTARQWPLDLPLGMATMDIDQGAQGFSTLTIEDIINSYTFDLTFCDCV
mmetsp:Transcript_11910/g.26061  ORF Transcript_11910/g.26061 Transcript_11910/m.26061 type:complete len:81 (+) Transcript_11910:390-632(+)